MKRFILLGLGFLGVSAACGGASDTDEPLSGAGGTANSTSGDGDGDSSGDGDSGTGGSGDGAGGGDVGSGGAPAGACSGDFGPAEPILSIGQRVTSPALTGDQMELFFVLGETYAESVQVSRRATPTSPLQIMSPVAEVDEFAGCLDMNKTVDVSHDGLRLYVSCYFDPNEVALLYQFERPERDAPFGEPLELGELFIGGGISADELSVYGSRIDADTDTLWASRSSREEAFTASRSVTGLEGAPFFAPAISSDGLELYGAVGVDKVFSVARRPSLDADFGTPVPVSGVPSSLPVAGAPELSADCRTILYVGVDNAYHWAFYQARR